MGANQPARAISDRVVLVGARGVISGAVLPHLGYAFSLVQCQIAKDSRVLKTTALIMVLTGSLVAPCVWGQDDFGDDESLQADDQSNDEAEESEGDTDTDESVGGTDVDDSAADETPPPPPPIGPLYMVCHSNTSPLLTPVIEAFSIGNERSAGASGRVNVKPSFVLNITASPSR